MFKTAATWQVRNEHQTSSLSNYHICHFTSRHPRLLGCQSSPQYCFLQLSLRSADPPLHPPALHCCVERYAHTSFLTSFGMVAFPATVQSVEEWNNNSMQNCSTAVLCKYKLCWHQVQSRRLTRYAPISQATTTASNSSSYNASPCPHSHSFFAHDECAALFVVFTKHVRNLVRGDDDAVLYRHLQNVHKGRRQNLLRQFLLWHRALDFHDELRTAS